MWTLILIMATYGHRPMAIDHVDGFQSQKACLEASRHIAKYHQGPTLQMYCVDKRAKF